MQPKTIISWVAMRHYTRPWWWCWKSQQEFFWCWVIVAIQIHPDVWLMCQWMSTMKASAQHNSRLDLFFSLSLSRVETRETHSRLSANSGIVKQSKVRLIKSVTWFLRTVRIRAAWDVGDDSLISPSQYADQYEHTDSSLHMSREEHAVLRHDFCCLVQTVASLHSFLLCLVQFFVTDRRVNQVRTISIETALLVKLTCSFDWIYEISRRTSWAEAMCILLFVFYVE